MAIDEAKVFVWRQFMKFRVLPLLALFLIIFLVACAGPQIYTIPVGYQPTKIFPSLQQKFGSRLGIAPFKDERRETSYIGIYYPLQGLPTNIESLPVPLERALQTTFGQALSWSGVKVVPVSTWDGTPESLKGIDADSVLTVEIKEFWTEGRGRLLGADIRSWVRLVIHLGVKREGKVFTERVEMERKVTVVEVTPERVQEITNRVLSDALDKFLSYPY